MIWLNIGLSWKIIKIRTTPFIFKIDLCSATSMESSHRDLLNDIQNTRYPRFSFTPKTGVKLPTTGVSFLLWIEAQGSNLTWMGAVILHNAMNDEPGWIAEVESPTFQREPAKNTAHQFSPQTSLVSRIFSTPKSQVPRAFYLFALSLPTNPLIPINHPSSHPLPIPLESWSGLVVAPRHAAVFAVHCTKWPHLSSHWRVDGH